MQIISKQVSDNLNYAFGPLQSENESLICTQNAMNLLRVSYRVSNSCY